MFRVELSCHVLCAAPFLKSQDGKPWCKAKREATVVLWVEKPEPAVSFFSLGDSVRLESIDGVVEAGWVRVPTPFPERFSGLLLCPEHADLAEEAAERLEREHGPFKRVHDRVEAAMAEEKK